MQGRFALLVSGLLGVGVIAAAGLAIALIVAQDDGANDGSHSEQVIVWPTPRMQDGPLTRDQMVADRRAVEAIVRQVSPHFASGLDEVNNEIEIEFSELAPGIERLPEIEARLQETFATPVRITVHEVPWEAVPEDEALAPSPLALSDFVPGLYGLSALISGELTLDDGCLYVVSGASRWVPVFPALVTRWDSDAEVLETYGRRYAMGETVRFGGGYSESDDVRAASGLLKPVPQTCEADGVFVVHHPP